MNNIRDFGAVGDGLTDDTIAIQAAVNAGNETYVPEGTFRITSTIMLNEASKFRGQSRDHAILMADNIIGPMVKTTGRHSRIENLKFSGIATSGISLVDAHTSIVENIHFSADVTEDHIYTMRSFGSKISDILVQMWKDGQQVNHGIAQRACIFLDSESNAMVLSNIYTSSYSAYGIYIDRLENTSRPQMVTITGATLQGHDIGLYARAVKGLSVSGMYTENTVLPIKLGDRAGGQYMTACTILGGWLQGPDSGHPNAANETAAIELDYAFSVTLSGLTFASVNTTNGKKAALVDLGRKIVFMTCDIPGGVSEDLMDYIAPMPGGDPDSMAHIKVI